VDRNEVGFSPQNVEALYGVGQSTKKGGDNATRYVGEKGIGFKSVSKPHMLYGYPQDITPSNSTRASNLE
jgi:hypothetical protein